MASLDAMKAGGGKRYFTESDDPKVAQGVSGFVQDRGSMFSLMAYLSQGLGLAMQDAGARGVADLHARLNNGELRFEQRSPSSQREGGVHDLYAYTQPDPIAKRKD